MSASYNNEIEFFWLQKSYKMSCHWQQYRDAMQTAGNNIQRMRIFKTRDNKLNFKGHPQRIWKSISDQNLFSRFRLSCWTAVHKMKLKDHAIMEKCYVIDSFTNLLGNMIDRDFWDQNSRTIKLLNYLK